MPPISLIFALVLLFHSQTSGGRLYKVGVRVSVLKCVCYLRLVVYEGSRLERPIDSLESVPTYYLFIHSLMCLVLVSHSEGRRFESPTSHQFRKP